MFANALRVAAILIVPLVFGCARSPTAASLGTASGESNPQAYRAAQEIQSQQRYAQSISDYRACLTTNQTDMQACEAKRLVMETKETSLDQVLRR